MEIEMEMKQDKGTEKNRDRERGRSESYGLKDSGEYVGSRASGVVRRN